MDAAIGVLSAVVTVGIGLFVNAIRDIRKDMKKEMDNTHSQLNKVNERQAVLETKVDIFLTHVGFDIRKVNKAIEQHMEELKKNDRPSVGCINITELYKDKNG